MAEVSLCREDGRAIRRRDVIVVLGGAVRPGGRPSAVMARRLARGVAMYRAGHADWLLVTGGLGRYPPSEAEVMRGLAVAAGVPAGRILMETRALSTLGNAVGSARLMKARGWRSALVVTDRIHLPRALMAFRAAGIRAAGSGVPRQWRDDPFRRWWHYVLYEAVGILWYAGLIVIGRHRA